jgi:hypothetical protein
MLCSTSAAKAGMPYNSYSSIAALPLTGATQQLLLVVGKAGLNIFYYI